MIRRKATSSLALVAGATIASLGLNSLSWGQSLVTEHFDSNTDGYWSHLNNKPADGKSQNYGWSAGDTTGTVVTPPANGTTTYIATAGGELGGTFTRIPEGLSNANYYGFNTGTLNPNSSYDIEARGVYHLSTAGGSTGLLLGFFKDANSFSQFEDGGSGDHHNDNPDNFMGIYMVDGNKPQGELWDAKGFEDRGIQLGTLSNGATVPFSIKWTKPPAGAHEKGTLTVEVNGISDTFDYTGDFNYNTGTTEFNYFGFLGAGHAGGSMTAFIDDVTFTSLNPIGLPGWGINGSGDWLVAGNWVGGSPNAIDATATFGSVITSNALVYANSNVTAGTVEFNNANTYLLAGLGSLTMQVSGGNALIDVQQGNHKINLPLIIASNTNLQVAGGATLKISDPVTVNNGVSLTTTSGTVIYESTITLGIGSGVNFTTSQHVAGLTVGSGSVATLAAGGGSNRVLEADSLSLTGKLDLQDNKMIRRGQGPGTWNGSAYTGTTGQIASGLGNGTWNGASGIVTSQTAATTGKFTSVGVAQASVVRPSTATATGLWAGQTISGGDTLVMYTYGGDANLDGKINVDDYIRIDSGISAGLKGWANGDFNYDGKVNIDDYTQYIDANIGIQGAAFPSGAGGELSGVSAVPEPASIAVIGLVAAAGSLRRRRR